jgi:hypothetical protein
MKRVSRLMIKKDPYSLLKNFFIAIVLVFLAWAFVFYLRFALVAPPSFDGAMNLNVAKSLADGKGYGSYYNEFKLFPKEVQTNLPFILPAAIAYAIGGVGIFTSQAANLIYLMFFSWCLYAVLRKLEDIPIAILTVFLVLQVPGIQEFGMSGYGEIPALSFLMLGLLMLNLSLEKSPALYAFWGGIVLGFSYLTKTVALLWIAPTMALFALLALMRKKNRISVLSLGAGFIVPVLGWELYRLLSLGDIRAYAVWWFDQLVEIFSQSGVHGNLKDTPGLLSKGLTHIRILAGETGTPLIFLPAMWIAPLPFIIMDLIESWRKGKDSRFFLFGALSGIALLYAIWWIFITPTEQAWLRRILNGLVLQEIVAVLIISISMRTAWKIFAQRNESIKPAADSKRYSVLLIAAIFLIGMTPVFFFIRGQVVFHSPPSSETYAEELEVFKIVRALPEQARIFGFGWWQAPVVALISGRNIDNLEKWRMDDLLALPEKYIVADQYALAIASGTIAGLHKIYKLNPIHISNSGTVFNIMGERTLKSQVDDSNSGIKSFIALDCEDYSHIRGLYEREGNMRWASPEVRILLWRTDENVVSAEVTLPDGLISFKEGQEKNGPLDLRLFAEGCCDAILKISKPGRYRIEAPLSCPPPVSGSPVEIHLTLNSQLDPKDIAPDVRSLAFLIHSVALARR